MFSRLNAKELEVLEPFYEDPQLEASIREIARKSNVSPAWTSKTVSKLENQKILTVNSGKSSKTVTKGEKFTEWKRIYNLDNLYSSKLIHYLDKHLRPEAIVLFGSYEKGEDLKDSDIDIAVIKSREREIDLERFEDNLERDINLTYIRNPEKGDKNFRNSIANGTILQGHLKVV